MKRYRSNPTTDVESVITAQEFADWTGADVADPLFGPLSIAATAAVIEFLQSELITRERVTVYEDWPATGTDSAPALSRNNAYLCQRVELPYARLSDPVTIAVEAGGDVTTDFRVLETLTAELYFDTIPVFNVDDAPALKMTYNAGFGTIDDVPQAIKTAVTMVTGHLYDHRGECSAEDAIKKSGADSILFPYKAKAVIL